MTRDEIVRAARRYVELKPRWRHRGRSETQLDCAGLLWRIQAVDFGMPAEDVEGYGRYPEGDRMIEHLKTQLDLRVEPPLPGSVIVLRDTSEPCHLGIMGSKNNQLTLIHCTIKRRGMYEEYWTRQLQADFRMAFDFKGVED